MNSENKVELRSATTTSLPYFITFDSKNNIINVKPLSMIDVGNYTLTVKAYESDAPSYYSEYTLKVEITAAGNSSTGGSYTPGSSYASKTNPLRGQTAS